jgi:hypothetical protein
MSFTFYLFVFIYFLSSFIHLYSTVLSQTFFINLAEMQPLTCVIIIRIKEHVFPVRMFLKTSNRLNSNKTTFKKYIDLVFSCELPIGFAKFQAHSETVH